MPPKRTTIKDVAREANVSIATVSRVLNGETTVNSAMAEQVHIAAANVGYRPNVAARSLASGEFRTIGIVVPDLGNQYFHDVLKATVSAARTDGFRIVIMDSLGDPDEEYEACRQQTPNVDGLILLSPRMSAEQLQQLSDSQIPVVLINRIEADSKLPTVVADNRTAIKDICRHLHERGHRRIVHLAGSPLAWQARERADALAECSERMGFELFTIPAGGGTPGGYTAADEALAHNPTAVVAFNDLTAFGFITRLRELNVAVPGDVAVTGFDDIDVARFGSPPLTTAVSPKAQLGRKAWDTMRDALDGKTMIHPLVIPAPVTLRRSTGASS
ncbi:LacI family DNA-binding transcriptional regulator [Corynebacterium glyciniphilum]|uniref:LacI family DNA-binding transcriptional regulator n=1 Tax=Corynebacterium glyciniphilum TaxID=1404244 RepID=UPI003FD61820